MPLLGNCARSCEGSTRHREQITDADAKVAMLEIAANYEKLAKRAEAREAGKPFPPNEGH